MIRKIKIFYELLFFYSMCKFNKLWVAKHYKKDLAEIYMFEQTINDYGFFTVYKGIEELVEHKVKKKIKYCEIENDLREDK